MYETLRRYPIVVVCLGLFLAACLMPAHYFDANWKNYVSCPSGYALNTDVHEYKPVMRDVGSGRDMGIPGRRYYTFDEECHSLTAPGETVGVRVPFMLVAFLLSFPVAFAAAWFYFHQLVNYKRLPKRNQNWFLRLNIYAAMALILAAPLSLVLFDVDWMEPANAVTHRPLLSYLLVCLGPTALTLMVSRWVASRRPR